MCINNTNKAGAKKIQAHMYGFIIGVVFNSK